MLVLVGQGTAVSFLCVYIAAGAVTSVKRLIKILIALYGPEFCWLQDS